MAADRKRLALEVAALLVVVALIVTFATRNRGGSDRHAEFEFMMGTVVSVTVLTPDADEGRAAIASAFSKVALVEALTSRYDEESLLSRLNTLEDGYANEPVGPEVARIVALSLAVAEASSGTFDITVAPLVDLWAFSEEDFSPPDEAAVEEALRSVGWEGVEADTTANTLTVHPGIELDLAGVAKGYAVDRAVAALVEAGIQTGVVDAGGDVGFVGTPPNAEGWRVGVKDPRSDGLLGVVLLDGGAIATSGDYQRYVMVDGVRYHHVLDPKTGYPARGVMSVTVAAGSAAEADALATAVFVLGAKRGMELIERTPGAEALVVSGDGDKVGEVALSSGLVGRFTESEIPEAEAEAPESPETR